MDTYLHAPFQDAGSQIRVLTLLPAANAEDTICCELQITDLPVEPAGCRLEDDYEALSYVWDDPAPSHSVAIDGRNMGVTGSVDTALRRLRHTQHGRRLWIDAVCINQTDGREKSLQVQRMPHIFNSAKRVLVWLGPGNEATDYAMRGLQELSRKRQESGFGDWSERARQKADDAAFRAGLQQLFARPWWTRVWTLTEMLVAPLDISLGCGYHWIPFSDAPEMMMAENASSRVHFASIVTRSRASSLPDEVWLPPVLRMYADCKATDARDHVFAVAALLPEPVHEWMLPDYNLSVSVVYQRATVVWVLERGDLGRHKWGRRFQSRPARADLPSWCFDFSLQHWGEAPAHPLKNGGSHAFSAMMNGHLSPAIVSNYLPTGEMKYVQEKGLLGVDGVFIDQVRQILDPGRDLPCLEQLIAARDEKEALRNAQSASLGASLPPTRGLRRLGSLVRDLKRKHRDRFSPLQAGAQRSASLTLASEGLAEADLNTLHALASDLEEDTLFQTKRGCCCRGGKDVREGDWVVVSSRSKYPLVLRSEDDGFWTLVSPAHVEGIMLGEFSELLHGLEQHTFWLR